MIKKIKKSFAVVHCHGKNKGKIIAKHKTKGKAIAQHKAIEINRNKKVGK